MVHDEGQEMLIRLSDTNLKLADPALIPLEVGDEGYVGDIYQHYGYLPYWGPGYVYPPYTDDRRPTNAPASRRPRGHHD